jgi:hypothetical protein
MTTLSHLVATYLAVQGDGGDQRVAVLEGFAAAVAPKAAPTARSA